ncbi:hypothetical protein FKW77_004956 [Venturia effusa]|uniref:Ubiquitin-like protease family profile domain-containing protein n=1 Tax=Venturia effusa TaxID=50376 RepID=A0A517L198_9PEZI|nr:hypothetical protein FKW77_004956 [Venturia effusa]
MTSLNKRDAPPDQEDERPSKRCKSGKATASGGGAAARSASNTPHQSAPAHDRAAIEAKIAQLEETPLKPRFDWLQRLVDATKQLSPEEWVTANRKTAPVKFREQLFDDQVIVAISAITEALQREYGCKDENNNLQSNLYSLMSTTTLTNAKLRPVPPDYLDRARVARPRGLLMFPWVHDPSDCASRTTSDGVKKAAEKSDKHIILVTVDPCSDRLGIPCIVIHDSSTKCLQKKEELWKFIQGDIKMTVSNLGAFDYPEISDDSLRSSGTLMRVHCAQAAQQPNKWACGIHAILNAWAQAMSFPINPGCELDDRAYKLAIDIINLALDGRASSKMIAVFLVETDFVEYKLGQKYRPLRKGRINRYHNLRSWVDMDDQIHDERSKFKEQVEELKEIHAQELSIMRFNGEDVVAETSVDVGEPISPAAVDWFRVEFDHPQAKKDLDLTDSILRQRGAYKVKSSEQPSQRSKNALLSEVLSAVASGPEMGLDQQDQFETSIIMYRSRLEAPVNNIPDQHREEPATN